MNKEIATGITNAIYLAIYLLNLSIYTFGAYLQGENLCKSSFSPVLVRFVKFRQGWANFLNDTTKNKK